VAIKPGLGAAVVMLWLWGIIATPLLIPGYYDVALRDLGLSLGRWPRRDFTGTSRASSAGRLARRLTRPSRESSMGR
jgi:hypothetical protein